jgi:hypothetical protein
MLDSLSDMLPEYVASTIHRRLFGCLVKIHLKRKTAWSNASLIGCRISCLIDSKEWHEGFVTQFHKSGKHFVEFRLIGEKRWLNMKKLAFYIVERPLPNNGSSEYKDDDVTEDANLAPIDVSVFFVRSMMFCSFIITRRPVLVT